VVFLEKMRWPDSVIRCPQCGDKRITKFQRKGKTGKAPHLYRCLEQTCDYQFSVTTGTIFHDSHLPLTKWFIAIALLADAKKSISANQLRRHLGVQYKTAWHLAHRIREAMKAGVPIKLSGIVEADETFVGGRYDKRRKRETHEKPCVVGVIQRGGSVRAQQIPSRGARAISGFLTANVEPGSQLMTDDYAGYKKVGKLYDHRTVNHSALEYVKGTTHTNTIENFWSLFKRGVIGSFHKVSIKHLDRYLGEFTYRQNNRKMPDLFGMTVEKLLRGSALQYKTLTAGEPSSIGWS
jgi:transposase-like protein